MILSEVLNNLLIDLDESNSDSDTVNKLVNFIDRAHKDLAIKEKLNKVVRSNSNNCRVNKPDDLVSINQFYLNGVSADFSINSDFIETSSDGAVKMDYIFVPETLGMNDDLLTNYENVEYIYLYCKYQFCMSEGQVEDAANYKSQLNAYKVIPNFQLKPLIDVYNML